MNLYSPNGVIDLCNFYCELELNGIGMTQKRWSDASDVLEKLSQQSSLTVVFTA